MSTNTVVSDWQDLILAVDSNEGIQRVSMATLRQLEGRQRVGKHVLSAIEDKLASLGLGHLPEALPNRQQQSVLLYRVGTPASEVIQAVRQGLTEPVNDTTYTYLHRMNTLPDPATVVSKEELGATLEQTAKSLLDLLSQVRPTEVIETERVNVAADEMVSG